MKFLHLTCFKKAIMWGDMKVQNLHLRLAISTAREMSFGSNWVCRKFRKLLQGS